MKFRNKYRIATTRLKYYDYSQNGMYFVTICTKNRIHYFGDIKNKIMNLSEIGKIAENEIQKTLKIRHNVQIPIFQIMPNHVHLIIEIYNSVETHCNASLQDQPEFINTFSPQKNNLASIVRGLKSTVKSYTNKNDIEFFWQPRFYEHIIRNEDEYFRISQYIISNPENWEIDENNI